MIIGNQKENELVRKLIADKVKYIWKIHENQIKTKERLRTLEKL